MVEFIDYESALADALLEIHRLEQSVLDEQNTNRELRERIATLERRPTVAAGTTWSRERDYTLEA